MVDNTLIPTYQLANVVTDTHCHLDFNKFDSDREAVLERAIQAGVERILIPGITLTSSQSVVKLAESYPILYAAVGVHPTNVDSFKIDALASLYKLASDTSGPSKVVAIGEIGLDYYWDKAPHDTQRRVLKEQLALATELNLPVIIHFREKGDAPDGPCVSDLIIILEEWVNNLRQAKNPLVGRSGVLHSFSGTLKTARVATDLGFYIGVTGPVTYRKDRQELITSLPLERLLIETDAPFLAPHPQRGKRNEPAYVRLIADKIALLHSRATEVIASATSENALRLFAWK